MKKEIRTVTDGVCQVTIADERFYSRHGTNPTTGLPEIQWVPSVTWIAGHYPKGIGFYKWLADKGWDEAEAIKSAAGDKGSRVHHAIVDLLDGGTVAMDAKYSAGGEPPEELSLEEYDCLRAFADFWKAREPRTLAREVTVFSAEHGYAGTMDWLGVIKGELWLLDWKTGQYVWPEHELQVSAYGHADWGLNINEELYHIGTPALPMSQSLKPILNGGLHLGILQVGYRKNKQGWKLTEVADQFPLFLAAKQIWAKECEGVTPLKRDYPLSVTLAKP